MSQRDQIVSLTTRVPVPLWMLIVMFWLLIVMPFTFASCSGSKSIWSDSSDEVLQLRKNQAVQAVQLKDALDRIQTLENDMDHIAPHTPIVR
jgi:hypothetical protein